MTKLEFIIMLFFLIIISLIYLLITIDFHPVIILIFLLAHRILIGLLISMWRYTFIFTIIMFLIIIRGLLIIFLYFARLISNEQNKRKWPSVQLYPPTLIIIILIFTPMVIKNKFQPYLNSENSPLININNKKFNNVLIIYLYPFNNITFICILYLLIALFTIIKICSIKRSSLRKLN